MSALRPEDPSRTTSLVARFLASYQSDRLQRTLTIAEDLIVREALEGFVLDEPQLHCAGSDRISVALAGLLRLVGDRVEGRDMLDELRAAIASMDKRIERANHANLIMREHLTMLRHARPK